MNSPRTITFLVVLLLIGLIWRLFGKREDSFFKVRESERLKREYELNELRRRNQKKFNDDLGQAKIDVKKTPLLSGFRADGMPHELLGISETATVQEIQKAYKEQMKHYHPDRIGQQGSREWNDAQQIATALGTARDAMLSKIKNK